MMIISTSRFKASSENPDSPKLDTEEGMAVRFITFIYNTIIVKMQKKKKAIIKN